MFGEILSSGVPGRLPTSCGSADWNKSGDALESISDLASPAVSLSDFYYQVAGFEFSSLQLFGEHLDGPAVQVDLPALGLDSAVPIFFFEGTADQQAPIELAEQYYEQIRVNRSGSPAVSRWPQFAGTSGTACAGECTTRGAGGWSAGV
jgi:hypothetical protein